MAKRIQEEATVALRQLNAALCDFASNRQPDLLVGQFLDDEGLRATQSGPYGISAWLLMTSGVAEVKAVRDLRNACIATLCRWVNSPEPPEGATGPEADNTRELRAVVPKMAWAFQALSHSPEAQKETAILQSRLQNARQPDGSWGFVVGQGAGDPIATAWVLKSTQHSPSFQGLLPSAETYLDGAVPQIRNACARLFALSALEGSKDSAVAVRARKKIKVGIKALLASLAVDPMKWSHPVNIDFNEGDRTRYVRLSSDIVLADCLHRLRPHSGLYLYAHTGKRLWRRAMAVPARFATDSDGHRPMTAFYFQLYSLLGMVEAKTSATSPPWLLRLGSKVIALYSFGAEVPWHTGLAIAAVISALLFLCLDLVLPANIALGVAAKAVADIGKSAYDSWHRDAS